MPEHSLKDKTAKGLLWGGINNGAMQVLNLVFGIITARILDDTDYGMVGMLSIFSLIAGSLQESGFTAALVNKKDIRHEDYNAVFWFCSGISLTLYLILFGCAPLIAAFYGQPALVPLARYSFLGFLYSRYLKTTYPARLIIRNEARAEMAVLNADNGASERFCFIVR